MKQRGVFLIGAILMGIYYFLFPRASGKELVIIPESYTSLSSYDISGAPASGGMNVMRSGDTAAYFNQDFSLVARYGSQRMAVDDEWLVLPGDEGLDIIDPDGRLRGRITGNSTPIARNGSLFVYNRDVGRLSRVDPSNGALIWTREFLSTLTVLDSADGRTLVGLLDGRALVLNPDGEILLRYLPGGSRVEAIYGGSLNSDGTALALVSGLNPQRFILLEERKNGFRPVSHHDTESDFRRFVPVGFVGDDNRVLYEGNDEVIAVDTTTYSITHLDLDGAPVDWADDTVTRTLALLGNDRGESIMKILSRQDLTFFESKLPRGTTGLKMDGENLILVGEEYVGVLRTEVQ